MPKKTTNEKLARVISHGLRSIEKKLVQAYRGISGLISALRAEMHSRCDRIERIILEDHRPRVRRFERKRRQS